MRALLGLVGVALGASAAFAAVGSPASAFLAAGPSSVVTTPQVRAELLAHAPLGVAPGRPLWLGLQIQHQPQWHTYWKNPGDSGLPTVLSWTLPAGLTAGGIDWPAPHKLPFGSLANYGYEGTVLLPVPVTVGPGFQSASGTVALSLKATWLVCKTECIPEEGEFRLELPVRGGSAAHTEVFQAAWDARPQSLAQASGQLVPPTSTSARTASVRIDGLPAEARGQVLSLYPETPEVMANAGSWRQSWAGSTWTADLPVSAYRSSSPAVLPVVLALESPPGTPRPAWRVELQAQGAWPPVAAPAQVPPELSAALARQAAVPPPPATGWLAALGAALLGGLILNLMPCVFPVLGLKLLALAQPATARQRQLEGLAFTVGVLLSMLALGGLLIGLRAAGEQLGWGFQLQSPAFVAALAVLFTVIGLNLLGVFDFRNWLPAGVAGTRLRHPLLDQALSGVLAVAVASPCTAPFMGAALGMAVTLPAAQALSIFAMLGVGMSLPYLMVSVWPAAARALPRPGPWMETLRRALAFPLLATVVWLLWVLGQQAGIDAASALLLTLLLLAALAWSLGLAGRARWILGAVSAASLATAMTLLGPRLHSPLPDPATTSAPTADWKAWSQPVMDQELAAGRTVLVDFTAAWCITCQVNKQTTLSDPALLQDLRDRGVTLLRADWTRRDPAITAALARLGRSGIPVYLLQAPGRPPVVLSELITPADVRSALSRL